MNEDSTKIYHLNSYLKGIELPEYQQEEVILNYQKHSFDFDGSNSQLDSFQKIDNFISLSNDNGSEKYQSFQLRPIHFLFSINSDNSDSHQYVPYQILSFIDINQFQKFSEDIQSKVKIITIITYFVCIAFIILISLFHAIQILIQVRIISKPIEKLTEALKSFNTDFCNETTKTLNFGLETEVHFLQSHFSNSIEMSILFSTVAQVFQTIQFANEAYFSGDSASSLIHWSCAALLFSKTNSIRAFGTSLKNIANIHLKELRFDEAIEYLNKSIEAVDQEILQQENKLHSKSYDIQPLLPVSWQSFASTNKINSLHECLEIKQQRIMSLLHALQKKLIHDKGVANKKIVTPIVDAAAQLSDQTLLKLSQDPRRDTLSYLRIASCYCSLSKDQDAKKYLDKADVSLQLFKQLSSTPQEHRLTLHNYNTTASDNFLNNKIGSHNFQRNMNKLSLRTVIIEEKQKSYCEINNRSKNSQMSLINKGQKTPEHLNKCHIREKNRSCSKSKSKDVLNKNAQQFGFFHSPIISEILKNSEDFPRKNSSEGRGDMPIRGRRSISSGKGKSFSLIPQKRLLTIKENTEMKMNENIPSLKSDLDLADEPNIQSIKQLTQNQNNLNLEQRYNRKTYQQINFMQESLSHIKDINYSQEYNNTNNNSVQFKEPPILKHMPISNFKNISSKFPHLKTQSQAFTYTPISPRLNVKDNYQAKNKSDFKHELSITYEPFLENSISLPSIPQDHEHFCQTITETLTDIKPSFMSIVFGRDRDKEKEESFLNDPIGQIHKLEGDNYLPQDEEAGLDNTTMNNSHTIGQRVISYLNHFDNSISTSKCVLPDISEIKKFRSQKSNAYLSDEDDEEEDVDIDKNFNDIITKGGSRRVSEDKRLKQQSIFTRSRKQSIASKLSAMSTSLPLLHQSYLQQASNGLTVEILEQKQLLRKARYHNLLGQNYESAEILTQFFEDYQRYFLQDRKEALDLLLQITPDNVIAKDLRGKFDEIPWQIQFIIAPSTDQFQANTMKLIQQILDTVQQQSAVSKLNKNRTGILLLKDDSCQELISFKATSQTFQFFTLQEEIKQEQILLSQFPTMNNPSVEASYNQQSNHVSSNYIPYSHKEPNYEKENDLLKLNVSKRQSLFVPKQDKNSLQVIAKKHQFLKQAISLLTHQYKLNNIVTRKHFSNQSNSDNHFKFLSSMNLILNQLNDLQFASLFESIWKAVTSFDKEFQTNKTPFKLDILNQTEYQKQSQQQQSFPNKNKTKKMQENIIILMISAEDNQRLFDSIFILMRFKQLLNILNVQVNICMLCDHYLSRLYDNAPRQQEFPFRFLDNLSRMYITKAQSYLDKVELSQYVTLTDSPSSLLTHIQTIREPIKNLGYSISIEKI